jgi:hypothetical protein
MTETPPREGAWAANVDRLHVPGDRKDVGFNVEGRRVAGPQQGFGRLWDRTFTVALGDAVTPEALVKDWRARFGDFWPKGNTFYGSITALEAGDVAPLTAAGVITTGVLVIYADDTSFSFITPEGHQFCGMITFSARRDEPGTVAEIRMLIRTADPSWELLWPVIKPMEARFWKGTLTNVAAAHGVHGVAVGEVTTRVDPRLIWRNWTNVFRNGAASTVLHVLGRPFRTGASVS